MTPTWKNPHAEIVIVCGSCGEHLTHKAEKSHTCSLQTLKVGA